MAAILADDIFKCIFLNENDRIPIQISLKIVTRSLIDNKLALVQVITWRQIGGRPLPNDDQVHLRLHAALGGDVLTHWGRVTHICVSKLAIIGSDNGLSPRRRQAIIWINAGILLIYTLGTNFSEILNEIHAFSFKKIHLKMSSAKWRPFFRPQCVNPTSFRIVSLDCPTVT